MKPLTAELVEALERARAALIRAGFVQHSPHGDGDPEINGIDAALTRARSENADGWRTIESAPNDSAFRWYGLHVQHRSGYEWFEAHYVSHDDDGQMRLPSGDNFDDWAFSDFEVWCEAPPVPAPPVEEKG